MRTKGFRTGSVLPAMTLAALVSGCGTVAGDETRNALCERTDRTRTELARALLEPDVPDGAVLPGARLIAQVDGWCAG